MKELKVATHRGGGKGNPVREKVLHSELKSLSYFKPKYVILTPHFRFKPYNSTGLNCKIQLSYILSRRKLNFSISHNSGQNTPRIVLDE